jgi:hypothetical protein
MPCLLQDLPLPKHSHAYVLQKPYLAYALSWLCLVLPKPCSPCLCIALSMPCLVLIYQCLALPWLFLAWTYVCLTLTSLCLALPGLCLAYNFP